MKDKLYDLIDKHHTLLGVCLFAGLFGIIFTSDNNQVAGSILLLLYLSAFCALMFYQLVSIDRSHAKALEEAEKGNIIDFVPDNPTATKINWRTLCAELLGDLESLTEGDRRPEPEHWIRVRDALAQTEKNQ
jgi:hypothetical protein